QAAQGALDLGTLLVAPAGNDGGAGPDFGSVAAPAAGAAALAVGAADSRTSVTRVRVVLRQGLDVILDEPQPLLRVGGPSHSAPPAVAGGGPPGGGGRRGEWLLRREGLRRGRGPPGGRPGRRGAGGDGRPRVPRGCWGGPPLRRRSAAGRTSARGRRIGARRG